MTSQLVARQSLKVFNIGCSLALPESMTRKIARKKIRTKEKRAITQTCHIYHIIIDTFLKRRIDTVVPLFVITLLTLQKHDDRYTNAVCRSASAAAVLQA